MDLEEAIKNLKKLIKLRKNIRGEITYDTCICSTRDLDIVLQALPENRWYGVLHKDEFMLKNKIKHKIQELKKM